MISKLYFEKTFSLATAQALQQWANLNLIIPDEGSYGMEVRSNTDAQIPVFAETVLSGLEIGVTYTIKMYVHEVVSNAFRVFANALPSDNSSAVMEQGWWGTGWNNFTFDATATTMYLAVGDNVGNTNIYSITDNISVKNPIGTDFVTNGTFEAGNTIGWYDQGTNAVITAYEYAVTPPIGDNQYLEPVNIPEYVDTGDDTDGLITVANGRWNTAYLNRADITNFYIEPGDYSSAGQLLITRSGTAVSRRTISLHNGNDTHPGKLPDNERAFFGLEFGIDRNYNSGVSYWTIDRLSYVGRINRIVSLHTNSTNNILNRMYTAECGTSVFIAHLSHNNTIQNSRFNSMSLSDLKNDTMGILMQYNTGNVNTTDYFEIHNTKIIANEFRNQNDSLHVARGWVDGTHTARITGNMEGTIVDSNQMYITDDIYTDGNGNLNPTGTRAFAENATDVKIGSANPLKPFIISNNIAWGYRRSDSTGTLLSSYGSAFEFHYGLDNMSVVDNFMFDNNYGIHSGDSGTEDYDMQDSEFLRNTVVDGTHVDFKNYPLDLNSDRRIEVHDNVIFDSRAAWMGFTFDTDMNVTDNIGVNITDPMFLENNTGGTYSPNTIYATAADGGYTEDFIFTADNYTTLPRVITIPNTVKP